ncbi:hypothetical protein V1508DRAFT_400369 [Lipomyces doorenjongii]|uniref:uncharacterized protein n=1 Tax=Lipomyces doorenjongii TaxID=383834 RepID=UPI0034CFD94B
MRFALGALYTFLLDLYGSRPDGMDKGILQRNKALELKFLINQTKSKRRRQQLLLTAKSPQDLRTGPGLLLPAKVSSLAVPSSTSTQHLEGSNDAVFQGELYYQINETDMGSFVDPPWSAPSYNDDLTADSFVNQEGYAHAPTFPKDMGSEHSVLSRSSEEIAMLLPKLPARGKPILYWVMPYLKKASVLQGTPSTSDKMIRSASQHGNDFPKATTSNDHMGSKSSAQPYSVTSSFGQSTPWPTALGDSILNGCAEDALLMHYLDEAFYIQYPFYHSNGRQGRGWAFSILRRDSTNLAQMRAKDGYYDLAFQEMKLSIVGSRTWNECTQLVHSLESLTSLLQPFFCELFAGGTRNWQGLLRT